MMFKSDSTVEPAENIKIFHWGLIPETDVNSLEEDTGSQDREPCELSSAVGETETQKGHLLPQGSV